MGDQMERFTFEDKLMNEAADAIFEWAEKYLSSIFDDDTGIVSIAGQDHFIVRYQLIFISNYALMMQRGNDLSQIERIKKFLDNQMLGNRDKLMAFRFLDGIPCEVYLFAESLGDLDIADIYGLTKFKTMIIDRNDGKIWSKKDIDSTVRKIREDMDCDGYEPEITRDYHGGITLWLGIELKNQNLLAALRIFLWMDKQNFEYMQLTLASSSDPRVRTMIAGMIINAEIVKLLEKDKDPDVLLNLLSNLFAFVHLKDRTIKRILAALLKSKILDGGAKSDLFMVAKRLHSTEIFRDVGDYDEQAMERWGDTWERNTKLMPIFEMLKDVAESYEFLNDAASDLFFWLEERIQDLNYILEEESS